MKVKIGDIVHFVMKEGIERPAIVTQVWSENCVNMTVFADGTNDGAFGYSPSYTSWQTSVIYSKEQKPNSWHYPED